MTTTTPTEWEDGELESSALEAKHLHPRMTGDLRRCSQSYEDYLRRYIILGIQDLRDIETDLSELLQTHSPNHLGALAVDILRVRMRIKGIADVFTDIIDDQIIRREPES